MQVQDMAYDSARSGSDRGGVSTINDGLADLGFGGTLTDATPLATQGGERRGLAAGNLWSFSRGDGPDAAGLRDPVWPCSALARTDGGPNSGNVTNSIAMNSDEFLAKVAAATTMSPTLAVLAARVATAPHQVRPPLA
jgi:hypothetical protein